MGNFNYHASITWPTITTIDNWFNNLNNIESWLNNNIGQQLIAWQYINNTNKLTIGFNKPEHKTFFLLYYNK